MSFDPFSNFITEANMSRG